MKTVSKERARRRTADLADLCARDVMQSKLVTVHASDPLREVERVLTDAKISGVPVLDDDGNILGVLSMRDLIRRYAEDRDLPEEAYCRDFDDGIDETEQASFQRVGEGPCVGDVMTTEIASVGPNASMGEIAGKMVSAEVHRLLVVDHGRVVGLVTTMDVLRAMASPMRARS